MLVKLFVDIPYQFDDIPHYSKFAKGFCQAHVLAFANDFLESTSIICDFSSLTY
jgi:hypothetical protein